MARKTVTRTSNTDTTAKKATARRVAARKTTRSSASGAVKKSTSTEIKPQRVNGAVEKLKSPKVLVPVAVAVGLGVAAVRKMITATSKHGPRALPRLAKEVSPRFSEAVRALADLGRELRSKIR